MRWNRLKIETTTAAQELLCYELSEMGIEGVEIEDHVALTEEDLKTMYVDLLPDEIAPDDGKAVISCYVEEDVDADHVIEEIRKKLSEISAFVPTGTGKITVSVTEEEDWINNWKVFFKPFRLDDNIVIKPTWETFDAREDDIVIEIDPGTAFGSGSHETTKLCISMLKSYIKEGMSLLDVGTGSGILSIIGLKLGAGEVTATDIDPNAIRAARENLPLNGITEDQARVIRLNILDEAERQAAGEWEEGKKYDIVVANILADVIIPLSGLVPSLLKENGIFISSGIIDTMEEPVKRAFEENGLEILEVRRLKDWVSITGRKEKR